MALTAAERAKKYREKLKQNPKKYEIQRQKQLERIKKNRKRINDLTTKQKRIQRKQWREQKKRQIERKRVNKLPLRPLVELEVIKIEYDSSEEQNLPEEPPPSPQSPLKSQPPSSLPPPARRTKRKTININAVKEKFKKICADHKKALNNIDKLKSQIVFLRKKYYHQKLAHKNEVDKLQNNITTQVRYIRKRYYRQKLAHKKEVAELQMNMDKLKARQEILELSVRKAPKMNITQPKKPMKVITINELTEKCKSVSMLRAYLGFKCENSENNENSLDNTFELSARDVRVSRVKTLIPKANSNSGLDMSISPTDL